MNRDKLRGRIIERFGTQGKFAETLGIEDSTLSQKLREKRDMTRSEIKKWCELLDISENEIPLYFFAN